jgi:hypothetical protein
MNAYQYNQQKMTSIFISLPGSRPLIMESNILRVVSIYPGCYGYGLAEKGLAVEDTIQ